MPYVGPFCRNTDFLSPRQTQCERRSDASDALEAALPSQSHRCQLPQASIEPAMSIYVPWSYPGHWAPESTPREPRTRPLAEPTYVALLQPKCGTRPVAHCCPLLRSSSSWWVGPRCGEQLKSRDIGSQRPTLRPPIRVAPRSTDEWRTRPRAAPDVAPDRMRHNASQVNGQALRKHAYVAAGTPTRSLPAAMRLERTGAGANEFEDATMHAQVPTYTA